MSYFPQDLRATLISIMINVHIDCKPRTEKNIPLYTKKLKIADSKYPKRNQFEADMKDLSYKNNHNPHEVLVDVSKINAFTKIIQNKESTFFNRFDDPSLNSTDRFLGEIKEADSLDSEMIEEFIQEDDSVQEEDFKLLKEKKILEYFANEVFYKKDKEISFNVLLINIIQLIKKLVMFNLFPVEDSRMIKPKKLFGNKRNNVVPSNYLSKMVKTLIDILNCSDSNDAAFHEKENKPKRSFVHQIFGTLGNVTVGMKNLTAGFGKIFSDEIQQKRAKKKRRESLTKREKNEGFVKTK